MSLVAGEVIVYTFPTGKFIIHDPERVTLIPSDGGRVKFVGEGAPEGEFIVGKSLTTYQVVTLPNGAIEVTAAHAGLEMVRADDKGSASND